MMEIPKSMWVIGWDYGTEGKSEPEMAFFDKAQADAAVELIKKNPSATTVYLTEVPVWRR